MEEILSYDWNWICRFICILFLKYPSDTRSLLTSAAGVVKHLPIDREAGDMLSPILEMTKNSGRV